MPAFLPPGAPIWLIILLGFVSLATMSLGLYRRWKTGEIQDDGVLLDRLDADNKNLRLQLQIKDEAYEIERIARRRAEDAAAILYRQLIAEGHEPKEVPQ